jgi:hypothetical protein
LARNEERSHEDRSGHLAHDAVAGFAAASGKLEAYVIDVEGGESVLIFSPGGQTMLIDAGWPASPNREASVDRIVATAQAAGVKQTDDSF